MGWFAKNVEWGIYECRRGKVRIIEEVPFIIGAGFTTDFQIPPESGVLPEHIEIDIQENGTTILSGATPNAVFQVNGESQGNMTLESGTDYLINLGSTFLLVRGDKSVNEWSKRHAPNMWEVIDSTNSSMQAMGLDALTSWANTDPYAETYRVTFAGVETPNASFPITNLIQITPKVEEPVEDIKEVQAIPTELPDKGPNLCPNCLHRFEDAFWVATHEDLRPDPVLKGNSFVRFMPSAGDFNIEGTVKDAMGSICREIACPHCRLILPHGFIQTQNHILSIVGDARSGKSYFLSVLVKQLPEIMLRRFNINFTDLDPEGNISINEMANTLFSRSGPDQARLLKTTLDGHMYQDIQRKGRVIKMPRPFIFTISDPNRPEADHAVTFYDNAGEHFQPGMDTEDRPGAQHVGNAAGILFMFDPFNSIEFRQRLDECKDPQMESQVNDLHRTMLAEIGARIRKKRNLPPKEKIDEPIAFVVGKCDAWMDIFPETFFDDPTEKLIYSCRLSHGEWDIGREVNQDEGVQIPLEAISGHHARLNIQPDRVEVTDLGSTHGTFVDGTRIAANKPTLLKPMSKLRLAGYHLKLEKSPESTDQDYPFTLSCLEEDTMFDMTVMQNNSDLMREKLMEVCPSVVASAERISNNVRYFPVSTFGHTPVKMEDGIAPDPHRLVPFLITTPALWILSKSISNLIPVKAQVAAQASPPLQY